MEALRQFWDFLAEELEPLIQFFTTTLFKLGDAQVSLLSIFWLILSFALLSWFSGAIKRFTVKRLLARYKTNVGVKDSYGTIVKYIIILIGTIVILGNFGLDFTTLGVIFGALGIGIGFGLQNIVNDLLSGVIIIFDQPIKVGDRVQVGDIQGDIIKIGGRGTTILTNDNINIIVPNSQFISKNVINWSLTDRKVRINVPLGVSYKEDPEEVKKVVLEVVKNNKSVLDFPKPDLIFTEYGNSSLNFELMVWSEKYIDRPKILRSELYYEIFKAFKIKGIEIPFPQRDINFRTALDIKKPYSGEDMSD